MSDFKERVNLAPLAIQFKEHGYVPDARSEASAPDVIPNSSQAYAEYARIKPELYAVGAVIADHVVRKAYNQRDITETVESLNKNNPFRSLGASIRDDIYASIESVVRKFEAGEGDTRLLSVYQRLKQLIELEHQIVPEIRFFHDVESFLQGGTSTAADFTSNILNMVTIQANDFTNPQRFITIAENSYPLVVKLAASHGDAVLTVIDALREFPLPWIPFKRDYFELEGDGNRERLAISERGKSLFKEITGKEGFKDFRSDKTPTVGCLAMANLGDGSAVRVVWDWHMEAARIIYPKLKPGPE